MRSRRASSLVACSSTASGMPASAIFLRYSSATEAPSSPSSRWIDSICLRRMYSRCCLSAPDWTSSRIFLRSCSSVRRSRWSSTTICRRSVTSSVSSARELVLEGDVGRVADRVGQRARVGDRAQERADALVGAAQLEDLLDDRAVLALEVAGAAVDRHVVAVLGDLDHEAAELRRCGRRPATPRATPERATARPPPGRRMWSVTSAIVPTLANSPSWRGTSRTRSSSPTRTGSVTSMVGKTTVSSSGTSRSDVMACGFTFCSNLPLVGDHRVAAAHERCKKISVGSTEMLLAGAVPSCRRAARLARSVAADDRAEPARRSVRRARPIWRRTSARAGAARDECAAVGRERELAGALAGSGSPSGRRVATS